MVNNTIIDWFLEWPEQALYAVATSMLTDNKMLPETHVDNVCWSCISQSFAFVFFFVFNYV